MPKIMKFPKDMYYTDKDVPLYEAGKEYSVPDNMVDRWIKRGGEVVVGKKPVEAVKPIPVPTPLPVPAQAIASEEPEEFEEFDEEEESSGTEKKTAKKKVAKKKSYR